MSNLARYITNILKKYNVTQKEFAQNCEYLEGNDLKKLSQTELSRVMTLDKLPPQKVLVCLSVGIKKLTGQKVSKEELIRVYYNESNYKDIDDENEIRYSFPDELIDVSAKTGNEILSSYDGIIKALEDNDNSIFRLLSEKSKNKIIGDYTKWENVMHLFPNSTMIIYKVNKERKIQILGDITLVFVKNRNEIEQKEDSELDFDDFDGMYDPGNNYVARIVSFQLISPYLMQKRGVLVKAFLEILKIFAKERKFMKKIYMQSYQFFNERLLISLGFQKNENEALEIKNIQEELKTSYSEYENDLIEIKTMYEEGC